MALLAQGIVGGDMPWPLVLVGILLGFGFIAMNVKSPMLVAVGMYLPFETTAAIMVGGLFRWLGDTVAMRRGYNEAQRARVENAGILTASGLIAGEAILGLVWAGMQFLPKQILDHVQVFKNPSYLFGIGVMLLLGFMMIRWPLGAAGSPDEPAPPTALM
jgi:uncharacterized oligopeptide transporter (OPT) family protein